MNALQDVKVLDLSQKLTVSLATMYLSQYGAEVTKLEMPGVGDKARNWEPKQEGGSLYFHYLNGGKKSMTLDITTKEGQEILKKLLPLYDVICVDTEAGYMDSLGLGYEDLKAVKADIIYGCYSYYGETGPYKNKPGSSLTVQAKGVAMDMTGVYQQYPVQAAPSIAEHYCAAYLATGILVALVDRDLRGIGQKVDIAMLDSIYSCIEAAPAAYSTVSEIHRRKGNFDPSCAPYDTFEAVDGNVAIGIATQVQWERFCQTMELPHLFKDSRFVNNEGRRTDYMNVLRPLLAPVLKSLTIEEIQRRCNTYKIPCSGVLTIAEITDLPNTIENGYLVEAESAQFGRVKLPAVPFWLSDTPVLPFTDAPTLGQDTAHIMETIGWAAELQNLKTNGII